jgi:hypothetical protein
MKTQEVIKWESGADYSTKTIELLTKKLTELIGEGYTIDNVIPTEYYGSNIACITRALIIVSI